MWFWFAIVGIIVAYVSGRKWGQFLYNHGMRRLSYILPNKQKIRPPTPTLSVVESDVDCSKKYDLEVQSDQVCVCLCVYTVCQYVCL